MRTRPPFALVALASAVAACSASEATPEPSASPSATSAPTAAPTTTTTTTATSPGTDAGPPAPGDASAPDGSTTKTCANGGYLFCEDFDALADGPATSTRWTNDVANGSLTIDAAKARSGKALKVHTNTNGRALMRLGSFAPPANSFYGRMYAWVTAFPSAPNYAHFTFVEAAGTGSGTLVRPIGGQYIAERGNRALWGVGSDGGPTGDWTRWKETAPAEAGKWLCLEWQMAAADNAVNVWIDGVAKPEMGVSTKNHDGNKANDFVFPTFNRITFGYWLYQGGSTPSQFDIWLDDIALSTTRIGC